MNRRTLNYITDWYAPAAVSGILYARTRSTLKEAWFELCIALTSVAWTRSLKSTLKRSFKFLEILSLHNRQIKAVVLKSAISKKKKTN